MARAAARLPPRGLRGQWPTSLRVYIFCFQFFIDCRQENDAGRLCKVEDRMRRSLNTRTLAYVMVQSCFETMEIETTFLFKASRVELLCAFICANVAEGPLKGRVDDTAEVSVVARWFDGNR